MGEQLNTGTILSIRGSVIDARFTGRLPGIFHVLRAGEDRDIIIEVNTHLNENTIRGIALTPTQGLARGSEVLDTGRPLEVPVARDFSAGSLTSSAAPSTSRERSRARRGPSTRNRCR